ncbi:MAG: bifunctional 5,10-methylenetetrahydrofolate dehydrogenase/5,10-methenyltetrahydrofolate cyclohydrolase [Candidatus Niyogibacteria bacterium]|nr:bifunctional 5,10-methylenetetrahydrofolate dehydrogenase/5,10-methenyltetrahydrofolate cyclohydrolase [Candidatus Niyogibacteria bacterium]
MDGKKLAEKIGDELRVAMATLARPPRLAIVLVGDDAPSKKFVERKRAFGEAIGVTVQVHEFSADITEEALAEKVAALAAHQENDGLIIQLPLPPRINAQRILDLVPKEKDADVLSAASTQDFAEGKSDILPPVVGAVARVFEEYNVAVRGKRAAVVGRGRLVGEPVALWLAREGATVSVITRQTAGPEEILRAADIIVSGVGKPGMIKADMIKEGAVVIDAGTASAGGDLRGDVDLESVAPKASLVTPTPGGVGPLTVAMVFKNLIDLITKDQNFIGDQISP